MKFCTIHVQDEFFSTGEAADASMDTTGYVYVPPKCFDTANTCLLHIHFHGCTVQAENVLSERW